MIKSKAKESSRNRILRWDDLASQKKPERPFSVIWMKRRTKSKKKISTRKSVLPLSDRLVKLIVENIKKGDMVERHNTLKKFSFKQSEEERTPTPCMTTFEYALNEDKPTQHIPSGFNIIDIDPDNLVNITSSIRGNISTFKLNFNEEENESTSDLVDDNDKIEKIFNSDILICDVTKNNSKILEVWNIVQELAALFEREETVMREENSINESQMKTIILISSLLTWSNTPELFDVSEFKLHECHYPLRSSHESFMPMYLLENELLNLGYKYRDRVRVLIVGTGIIYGPRETDLAPLFELSICDDPELPIFGTGQNCVSVIHIEDFLRFLNTVIHNFPEDYEYIFAVEPGFTTQSQIINVLCKSFGINAHSRFVSNKCSLLYDISEEDACKLSANLPTDSSYHKIVNFKNQHRLIYSLPSLARRYYTLKRQFKPPCIIIAGPPAKRTGKIVEHLSSLLGTVHLSPNEMLQSYMVHLGTKESNQRKRSLAEKSVNDLSSLPRGKGLMKILHRILLQPKVQKNGYVLEGYPETYKEAIILDKIIETISENDSINFPSYDINGSLTPDNIIILLMDDKHIMKETNYCTDEHATTAAEILFNLDCFRSKLSDENFFIEFYESNNIHPKLINVGEYETDYECAQIIADFLKAPSKRIIDIPQVQNIKFQTLINMMLSRDIKHLNLKAYGTNEPKNLNDIKIDLDTKWKIEETTSSVNEESNLIGAHGITGKQANGSLEPTQLSLKFSISEGKKLKDKSEYENKVFFERGTLYDKVTKPIEGIDGNVSKCCLKNMKPPKKFVPGFYESKSSSQASLPIRRDKTTTERSTKNSCRQKGKGFIGMNKDEFSPEIVWSVSSNKVLKGLVIGWCKVKEKGVVENNIESRQSDRKEEHSKQSLNISKERSVSDVLYTEQTDVISEDITLDESVDPSIRFKESYASISNIDPKLSLACTLFRNEDMGLYKNWYMFVDPSTWNFEFFLKKDKDSEEIALIKSCQKNVTKNVTNYVIENICQKREPKITCDDRKSKPIIKVGENARIYRKGCSIKTLDDINEPNFQGQIYGPNDDIVSKANTQEDRKMSTNEIIDEFPHEESENSRSSGKSMSDTYSRENYLSFTSNNDTIDNLQTSLDLALMLDSSNNIDLNGWKANLRNSEVSHLSGRSILKVASNTSSIKKSTTSINRKVRFSTVWDKWTMKTFDDKFNSWVEAHIIELTENDCLKMHDACFQDKGDESCPVYLYKNLLQQVPSDWRNDHFNTLTDSAPSRNKLINYYEMQVYFTKHWSHFRTNPPNLSLLPSSVMIWIEKNYICDSVRSHQKKTVENICDEQFKVKSTCICNKTMPKIKNDGITDLLLDNRLKSRSLIDIFTQDRENKGSSIQNNSVTIPATIMEKHVLYTDCKKVSSWESIENGTHHINQGSNSSITPLWQDEKSLS